MTLHFHLAFPVTDLSQTKAFYVDGLGCLAGRESPSSLILNLHGHQIVAHVSQTPLEPQGSIYPRHFGLIFDQEADWEALVQRAKIHGLSFYQEPRLRFAQTPLEHRTFFLEDPFHNLLEFKFYRDPEAVFGAQDQPLVGDGSA
ncbi:VOC family protein [Prochlorothrix hollandica]|uniref:Glyoxalase n=1 Tax=Prochlorothrix hollandica PCC 9006 = CALU 1027 TaxID=317619 RepID=A0A0M2PQL9_PROHO|nr:VOC family protein [Prochlorothrix hollandica]KKI98825.1 glyoxalase [Prochlorothrix hollandica PCC 9006 = CALU 1027]